MTSAPDRDRTSEPAASTDSFPRLAARTVNFTLGTPRGFVVSPDGERVAFTRTASGTSRTHALWVHDVAAGRARLVAEPAALLAGGSEDLTPQERARRERMRVRTAGVVAFSTDARMRTAAFALSSRLVVADLTGTSAPRIYETAGAVVDPQLDPTGSRVAYAADRGVHVVELDSGADRLLIGPDQQDPPEVVWGLAEFAAAEELDRARGFWWAPDGQSLLVERYDETPVPVWYIADPAHPDRPPAAQRYPQAGTANAVVSLALIPLTGEPVPVDWRSDVQFSDGNSATSADPRVLEYLAAVEWSEPGLVLALLTRDQQRLEFRVVDPADGSSSPVRAIADPAWVELLPGTPKFLPDGRLLHGLDRGDTRQLAIDGQAFSPVGLQVRAVLAVEDDGVVASVVPAVGSIAVARLGFDGSVTLRSDPGGVATGAAGGGVTVVAQRTLADTSMATSVLRGTDRVGVIESTARRPPFEPNLVTLQVGARDYPATLLWPRGHVPGSARLPVLMDPYGGPHGQRVQNFGLAYLNSQWFADQGFAVIVADGRGMAGRGPAWDRLARHDFIGTIDDQAEVLAALARMYPDDLDTSRVGIRGWSFGGYIAALGVLRRPDVFGAAVAGAPVTDLRLYDTCYTERYLGDPTVDDAVYEANSLIPLAPQLTRPLMLVHGLADDNVAVAHTLQLSSALLAAGKPHEVLPLSGMTHMADSEVVAENLLLLQVEFLKRSLGISG